MKRIEPGKEISEVRSIDFLSLAIFLSLRLNHFLWDECVCGGGGGDYDNKSPLYFVHLVTSGVRVHAMRPFIIHDRRKF